MKQLITVTPPNQISSLTTTITSKTSKTLNIAQIESTSITTSSTDQQRHLLSPCRCADVERVVLRAVLAESVVAPLTVHGLLWDAVEGHRGTADAATLQQVAYPGHG